MPFHASYAPRSVPPLMMPLLMPLLSFADADITPLIFSFQFSSADIFGFAEPIFLSTLA
jgi:hypothetical protein